MDQRVKELWVNALKSGQYLQGVDWLRDGANDNDTYCCLGVLCDLAVQDGALNPPIYDEVSNVWSYDGSTAFLPYSVQKWAGLEHRSATFQDEDGHQGYNTLVHLNDRGMSFTSIAKIIEEKF